VLVLYFIFIYLVRSGGFLGDYSPEPTIKGGTNDSLPLPTCEARDLNMKTQFKFFNFRINLASISKQINALLGISKPIKTSYLPKPALIKATPFGHLSDFRGIKYRWMDTPKYHLKYGEVNSIAREISDNGLFVSLCLSNNIYPSNRTYNFLFLLHKYSVNFDLYRTTWSDARPGSNPLSNSQTTMGNRPVNSNNEFDIKKFEAWCKLHKVAPSDTDGCNYLKRCYINKIDLGLDPLSVNTRYIGQVKPGLRGGANNSINTVYDTMAEMSGIGETVSIMNNTKHLVFTLIVVYLRWHFQGCLMFTLDWKHNSNTKRSPSHKSLYMQIFLK